jgi:hypothetical protein
MAELDHNLFRRFFGAETLHDLRYYNSTRKTRETAAKGVSDMAKASIGRRGPTAVDTHVGQKIRARRIF